MGVFSTAVRRTSEEKVMEHRTVAPTKNICLNYAIDVVFLLATIYMPTCLGGKSNLINDLINDFFSLLGIKAPQSAKQLVKGYKYC